VQVENYDGSDERLAVAACCLQTDVLAKVCKHVPEKPFANTWANLVFGWAAKHYREFNEAPGPATLTAIYGEWSITADRANKAIVEKFLSSLKPVDMNADYCVDLIERTVSRNVVKSTIDRANAALSNGETQRAADTLSQFKMPVFAEQSDYISPLEDATAVSDAFNQTKYQSVIQFPPGSAMAQWFGPSLHLDALVSFIGTDGSGKSSHLAALCQRAVLQNRRVAFFNLGDLSREQCLKRWTTAFVGKPMFPGKYCIPESIGYEEKEIKVSFSERYAKEGYTEDEATAAWAAVASKGDPNRLRIISKPARTFSVADLDNKLDAWATQGWLPEIVAVDYAGLIARDPAMQTHEAIDHNFAMLRMISSKYKILVLTASQSKASGYTTRWLGLADFEGSKGINAHCNGVIGINLDQYERQQQVVRFNWIKLREQEYLLNLPTRQIAVAGSPSIGRYHLKSEFV